jgi:adenine-specific DNA-methyltransferase
MPTRAELIWDGKYDAKGNRVAPLRVALPFQTVETINESAQDRLKLFQRMESEQPWRNRLIWGDKKYVLPSLLPEFAGKVNLIYIDPPFDTGADFSFTANVPPSPRGGRGDGGEGDNPDDDQDDSASFTKEPSLIEQKAYRDTWGRGLDSYLQWFYETVVILYELLAENGSIYVHLDYRLAHYAKTILDEIFGPDRFVNEIVWRRAFAHNDPSRCGAIHDTLFLYGKSPDYVWNKVFQKPSRDYIEQFFDQYDEVRQERYARLPLDAPRHGDGGNLLYEWKGVWPSKNRTWAYVKERMEDFERLGRIHYPKKGIPRLKRYESEYEGTVLQDIWTDVNKIHNQSSEQLHYPTQKPEALLDRIIRASSNEGDLVLDCFVGSGTTAAVAEKLNRRWIACDLGRFAIHTTRKRLLGIPGVRPFIVQNLGKYERQLWLEVGQAFEPDAAEPSQPGKADLQKADIQTADIQKADERHRAYVAFILKLYGATPIGGRTWLHGVRAGRMVHVGGVEAPVSVGDVKHIVAEFKKAMGTGKAAPATNGVDCLGWDFAFEINEVARQQAADANIKMTFKRIPRDVMDKRAVAQGEIKFFELAALGVEVKTNGKRKPPHPRPLSPEAGARGENCKREVTLTLTDFVIPPDDVPEEVREAVKHWSQWIDKGDTFHWQAFRSPRFGAQPNSMPSLLNGARRFLVRSRKKKLSSRRSRSR